MSRSHTPQVLQATPSRGRRSPSVGGPGDRDQRPRVRTRRATAVHLRHRRMRRTVPTTHEHKPREHTGSHPARPSSDGNAGDRPVRCLRKYLEVEENREWRGDAPFSRPRRGGARARSRLGWWSGGWKAPVTHTRRGERDRRARTGNPTARRACGSVNRIASGQDREPGRPGRRERRDGSAGEQPQRQGVKAPRGRSASRERQGRFQWQRHAALHGERRNPKLDEPQDRQQENRERPSGGSLGHLQGEVRRKRRPEQVQTWNGKRVRAAGRTWRHGDPGARGRGEVRRIACGHTVGVVKNDENGTLERENWLSPLPGARLRIPSGNAAGLLEPTG